MRISDRGLLEICEHEGIVPAPYRDSVGVWTFGVGHTAAAGGLDPETMERGMPPVGKAFLAAMDLALETFREDVPKYEARVNEAIRVPLEQHEFDALVSWDFNTGGALWRHPRTGVPARLVSAINAGDPAASRHFFGWMRPSEIRKRRAAERALFETGDYDGNGDRIPVWTVDGNGKLRGIHHTMSGDELLARMGRQRRRSRPWWRWW